MAVPDRSEAALAAMGQLQELLADPEARKQFLEKPDAALSDADVQTDDIPSAVLDALKSLSSEELDLFARLNATFSENGLVVKIDGGTVTIL